MICKPGRENLDFLQVKKSLMTGNTKKYTKYWSPLYPGKILLKSKGGSIRFSDIQRYLTWLKVQECYQFSWFLITLMIRILNSSVHQKMLLEKWHVIISNQGKPFAHWSKMAVSTRDRLHNSSFFPKTTHPLSGWVCVVQLNGGRTCKTKWIQHNILIFISISIGISCACRLAHCIIFAKCQGWYTICWDKWETKTTN